MRINISAQAKKIILISVICAVGAGIVSVGVYFAIVAVTSSHKTTIEQPTESPVPQPEVPATQGYDALKKYYTARDNNKPAEAASYLDEAEAAFTAADDQQGLETVTFLREEAAANAARSATTQSLNSSDR